LLPYECYDAGAPFCPSLPLGFGRGTNAAMSEALLSTAAPCEQTMTQLVSGAAAADRRAVHVAKIKDTSGSCFCCTTPLAGLLWCSGAVRGEHARLAETPLL
jgi:hypothetical protein